MEAWFIGHVFLAGDAAHIHSPFGGQGMNTGIQDAYNLAWKLALVHQGKAPITLLETYEEERLPVARHVLQGTHAGTSLLVNRNPALRLVRDQVLGRLLSMDIIQQKLAQEASELDIHYRTSSLSQSYGEKVMDKPVRLHRQREKPSTSDWLHFRNAPHAGERAPDGSCLLYPSSSATTLFEQFQGTTSTLLLFAGLAPTTESYAHLTSIAQKVEAALSNEIKVRLIVHGNEKPEHLNWNGPILLDTDGYLHTLYGVGVESLYFIRPDGYIGLRGQPAREEPLFDYLGKLFLLK